MDLEARTEREVCERGMEIWNYGVFEALCVLCVVHASVEYKYQDSVEGSR